MFTGYRLLTPRFFESWWVVVGWLWGIEICLGDDGACITCVHWLPCVDSSFFEGGWVVVGWLWGMEICLGDEGACKMSVH